MTVEDDRTPAACCVAASVMLAMTGSVKALEGSVVPSPTELPNQGTRTTAYRLSKNALRHPASAVLDADDITRDVDQPTRSLYQIAAMQEQTGSHGAMTERRA